MSTKIAALWGLWLHKGTVCMHVNLVWSKRYELMQESKIVRNNAVYLNMSMTWSIDKEVFLQIVYENLYLPYSQ
jgi:hypothetical protein